MTVVRQFKGTHAKFNIRRETILKIKTILGFHRRRHYRQTFLSENYACSIVAATAEVIFREYFREFRLVMLNTYCVSISPISGMCLSSLPNGPHISWNRTFHSCRSFCRTFENEQTNNWKPISFDKIIFLRFSFSYFLM